MQLDKARDIDSAIISVSATTTQTQSVASISSVALIGIQTRLTHNIMHQAVMDMLTITRLLITVNFIIIRLNE